MPDIYRLNIKNQNAGYDVYNLRDSRFDTLSDSHAALSSKVAKIGDEVSALEARSANYVEYTLKASSWTEQGSKKGGEPYSVYDFGAARDDGQKVFPPELYDITIEPSENITRELYLEWCAANIVGSKADGSSTDGGNVIVALGTKPMKDIPIMIRVENRIYQDA